jgi:hypothetical protein
MTQDERAYWYLNHPLLPERWALVLERLPNGEYGWLRPDPEAA